MIYEASIPNVTVRVFNTSSGVSLYIKDETGRSVNIAVTKEARDEIVKAMALAFEDSKDELTLEKALKMMKLASRRVT